MRAQSPDDCRARRGDVAGLFRRALVPTSRSSTSHRGTPGRRNKEELQRTAVDRQPLLSGKLFIQVGRGDLAVAAANDEHVSPLSHCPTWTTVRPLPWPVLRIANVTYRTRTWAILCSRFPSR